MRDPAKELELATDRPRCVRCKCVLWPEWGAFRHCRVCREDMRKRDAKYRNRPEVRERLLAKQRVRDAAHRAMCQSMGRCYDCPAKAVKGGRCSVCWDDHLAVKRASEQNIRERTAKRRSAA